MANSAPLLLENPAPHVLLLRLNRPEAANALNTTMAQEIHHAFTTIANNIRAIIITGNGKHFCSGADLKDRKGMTEQAWHTQHDALESARAAILSCPLPVIAAVNGAAYGGGLELALVCDFIYASAQARFALSETTLGIMPGMGGTQTLPRRIGHARASEMIWKGTPINAAEAVQLGLASKLCENLMEETLDCANIIAQNAPLSVRATKRAMREGSDMTLQDALQCELAYYKTLLHTKDREEGINAFNEKRKAVFTGT